ncbi:hypothetical protein D1871_19010 [Nakamurella silvestris]|nr:hypothetical protein D1871_19010 [Nakamurella silvestris]
MNSPGTSRFGRRTFLLAAGGAALPLAAACNPFGSSTRATTTVTADAPPPVDALPNLIATTRFHLVRIDAAIAADKTAAKQLTDIRSDRAEHLKALEDELTRTSGVTSPAAPSDAVQRVEVPQDPVDIMALVRSDAANDQLLFNDALLTCTPFRAALYATISACLASHRAVTA